MRMTLERGLMWRQMKKMFQCKRFLNCRVILTTLGIFSWLLYFYKWQPHPVEYKKQTTFPVSFAAVQNKNETVKCNLPKRPLKSYPQLAIDKHWGDRIAGYSQVTYLSPDAPAVCNSDFPYVHMPASQLDPQLAYFGETDMKLFAKAMEVMLLRDPEWQRKRKGDIKKLIRQKGRDHFSKDVLNGVDQLFNYSAHGRLSQDFGHIKQDLVHMQRRKFPDKPRAMSCNRCFVYDFKNIITPKGLCADSEQVELVGVVTIVPLNTKARKWARSTWAAEDLKMKFHFKVVFLFGAGWPAEQVELLRLEHERHNDILMDDFVDDYYNLAQKVLMGFHWVLRECRQAKFVMRGADDTKIMIPEVFALLEKFGRTEGFQRHQVGRCYTAYRVYRGAAYKGYVSTLEYDQDVLPPYAVGTVFFTSIGLVRDLLEISPDVPYMSIEDAYFGLVLAKLGRGCHNVEGMGGGSKGRYTSHGIKI